MRKSLLVMAKTPVFGKCKTRLAADVGDEKALECYLKMFEKTLNNARAVDAETTVHFSESNSFTTNYSDFKKDFQVPGNLGVKMSSATEKSFEKGANHAIIIGTDCPDNSIQNINDAFEFLQDYDVIIGPSGDGGYYMLGMSSMYPELFKNIEWSTDAVFNETIKITQKLGLKVKVLPEINDLDHLTDVQNSPFFKELFNQNIIELL